MGFELPPYPYDRVRALGDLAQGVPGGAVDCSVGTPCDPPPEVAIAALTHSGAERGYPPAAGSASFLEAAGRWLNRRFQVDVPVAAITPCVGTKELVASVVQHLRLRQPERDVVLCPAVAYPTYAMGARLAGGRAVPVPARAEDGTPDLSQVAEADLKRALALWVNSPSNPTGRLTDLEQVAEWGRRHGVLVLSDECYCEFTWSDRPRSILEHGLDGVVAVHSLSKRSNLAGLRVGFIAGDPDVVGFLREVRRHAGMMVPGPVQAAATAALNDDEHVERQRRRYQERLELLGSALRVAGYRVEPPAGGFYLWAGIPPTADDAWQAASQLVASTGLLASPGDLYGPGGAGHLRVAVVQPTERLRAVAERLLVTMPVHE